MAAVPAPSQSVVLAHGPPSDDRPVLPRHPIASPYPSGRHESPGGHALSGVHASAQTPSPAEAGTEHVRPAAHGRRSSHATVQSPSSQTAPFAAPAQSVWPATQGESMAARTHPTVGVQLRPRGHVPSFAHGNGVRSSMLGMHARRSVRAQKMTTAARTRLAAFTGGEIDGRARESQRRRPCGKTNDYVEVKASSRRGRPASARPSRRSARAVRDHRQSSEPSGAMRSFRRGGRRRSTDAPRTSAASRKTIGYVSTSGVQTARF